MNDQELITAVREQRDKVHMTTPVEQVISRGRTIRSRRRMPGLAGAVAVAAAAAFAVTALAFAGHPANGLPGARLAAWTVVKRADGTVYVTIRQLSDPAGLQSQLRADGVPASVTFVGQDNPSCHPYGNGGGPGLTGKVAQPYPGHGSTVVVIHPSALPGGAGLQLGTTVQQHVIGIKVHLVRLSQQCTGS
jgi:hypothetical protein